MPGRAKCPMMRMVHRRYRSGRLKTDDNKDERRPKVHDQERGHSRENALLVQLGWSGNSKHGYRMRPASSRTPTRPLLSSRLRSHSEREPVFYRQTQLLHAEQLEAIRQQPAHFLRNRIVETAVNLGKSVGCR